MAMRSTARELRKALRIEAMDAAALELGLAEVLAGACVVASYVATAGEPGITPRPGWLLPILLPGGDLDWAAYDGRLAPGPHGLREPAGTRLGPDAIGHCDLVLVPALRVDRYGRRLGRGGGSYDRALRRTRGLIVALLYDGELVAEVPTEAHDVDVHAVVSPVSGLVRLEAR